MHHHQRDGAEASSLFARVPDEDCIDPAPLGARAAPPAGLSPPHKDEAPRLAGAEGFGDQDKADTPIVADLDGQRKAFMTLRARFAMSGLALLELSDGSLLATRWNLCRPLADATAALRFLRQIGGAA